MAARDNPSPADSDLLCENCGYILNGLDAAGNCPECGTPIAPSTIASPRKLTSWEDSSDKASRVFRFAKTTAQIIFAPRKFYRNVRAQNNSPKAHDFAQIHWALCAVLFGVTAWMHAEWYERTIVRATANGTLFSLLELALMIAVSFVAIGWTTRLAARLTAWEGRYRGYRLPYPVVIRALFFHAAHFLPVALIAFITVAGYTLLQSRGVFDTVTAVTYLYVLSAEVIVGAVYLFNTYWIGMRNLMYANY